MHIDINKSIINNSESNNITSVNSLYELIKLI